MPTGAASNKEETPATAAKESYSGGKEATKAPFTTAWLSQVPVVTKPQAQQPAVPTPDETAGTAPDATEASGAVKQGKQESTPITRGRPRTGPTTAKSKEKGGAAWDRPTSSLRSTALKKQRSRGEGEEGGGKTGGLLRWTPPPQPPQP